MELTMEQRIERLEVLVAELAGTCADGFIQCRRVDEAQDGALVALHHRCDQLRHELHNTAGQLSDMRGE